MSAVASAVATTLVTGASAFDRDSAIAAALRSQHGDHHCQQPGQGGVAIILEGLADPTSPLVDADFDPAPHIQRIAPGCLCCAGNLVLRVTLNRLLRRPPAPLSHLCHLYISLADATHVGQLRALLSASPYDALLSLCDDLAAPASAA